MLHDINSKKELDGIIRKMITQLLDVGDEYPNMIKVSPEVYQKFEQVFPKPYQYPTVFEFDNIPVQLDETLSGETIYLLHG